RKPHLHPSEALLRILAAFLLDLVLIVEGGKLAHALAIDRALALLHRAFDTSIFGHAFDPLGVDLLGFGVELAFMLGVVGGKAGALGLEAGELLGKGDLLNR